MAYNHKKVQRIKEQYPAGTRIQLQSMSGETDMPSGLMGTVDFVDDAGQLQMTWDNGRSLALVPGEDRFSVVPQSEPEQEPILKTKLIDALLEEALENILNDMQDIGGLNELAHCIQEIKAKGNLNKYKAVLEAAGNVNIHTAHELAQDIDGFIFHPEMAEPRDYAIKALDSIRTIESDEEICKYVNLEAYGQMLMQRDNAVGTSYGVILREDGAPIQTQAETQKQAQSMNMNM